MKHTLILAALAGCGIASAEANFAGLGDLAGGEFYSQCRDISANGQWIVGTSKGANGDTAFRWSAGTGMLSLGDLPGGIWFSQATGISANGAVICGHSSQAGGDAVFRWTSGTGLVALPDLPGGITDGWSGGISDDGNVIIGSSFGVNGDESCRWVGNQVYGLGDLQVGSNWAQGASAVSGNGSVIAGYSGIDSDGVAYRWTQSLGMLPISNQDGNRAVHARDITPDGSTIVGWGSRGDGFVHAYSWTATGGMHWYPGVATATRISADGRFIVGTYFPNNQDLDNEAAFFDPMFGWRRLNQILPNYGASGFVNWNLESVEGLAVVNDQVIVCGNGINPQGQHEAFVATFPVPHQYLGGQCVLQDVNDMTGQLIWIEVREQGTNQVLGTYPAVLDAVGRFQVETEHMAGTYAISVKSGHHLRQTLPEVELTGEGASLQLSLINGDVDGSNDVGIGDYSIMSASWNLSKGDTGYQDEADLNIDDSVDIGDYAILSANYGLIGDD